jgi:hypothetical protein
MNRNQNKKSIADLLYLLVLCRWLGDRNGNGKGKRHKAKSKVPVYGSGRSAGSNGSNLPLRDPKEDPLAPDFYYYEIHKEITGSEGQIPIRYDLKIPQLKYENTITRHINHRIAQICQTLLTQMQGRMKAGDDDRSSEAGVSHYLYQADYRITYFTERYLCILIEEYENKGGAHGMPYREPLIFSLQTGEEVCGDRLFALSDQKRKQAKEQAFAAVISGSPKEYWENAMQTIREEESGTSHYYLTESGTTFYYPPYELAPYAYGYVEATVPYSQLPLIG